MGFRRFVVDFGTYNVLQTGASFLQFLWGVYLANYVGSGEYGKFVMVVAYVAMFGGLLDFGMELVVVRNVARERALAPKYFGGIAFWHTMFNLLVGGGVLAGAWLFEVQRDIWSLIALFYASTALGNILNVGTILLQAFERFAFLGILGLVQMLGTISFGAAALWMDYGICGVFSAYLVIAVLTTPVVWIVALKEIGKIDIKFERSFLAGLFGESAPLGLVALFSSVHMRADRVILSQMTSLAAVGWYSAASMIVQGVTDVVWSTFNKATYPILSRISKTNDLDLKKLIEIMVVLFGLISIVISIIVSFLADKIIGLFYRWEDVEGAADALQLLIWTIVPTILWAIYRNVILIKDGQRIYSAITATGMVVNVGLNVVLIAAVGWIGSAYASILTQTFLLIITYGYVHRVIGSTLPVRAFIKVSIVGVLLAISLWLVDNGGNVVAFVPFLLAASIAIAMMMRVVSIADLMSVRRILER